jgi:hypothetical protein
VNPQACTVGVQTTSEPFAYEGQKSGPIDLMAPSVTLDFRAAVAGQGTCEGMYRRAEVCTRRYNNGAEER